MGDISAASLLPVYSEYKPRADAVDHSDYAKFKVNYFDHEVDRAKVLKRTTSNKR